GLRKTRHPCLARLCSNRWSQPAPLSIARPAVAQYLSRLCVSSNILDRDSRAARTSLRRGEASRVVTDDRGQGRLRVESGGLISSRWTAAFGAIATLSCGRLNAYSLPLTGHPAPRREMVESGG